MDSEIKKALWRHGQSSDIVEIRVGIMVKGRFVITISWLPRVLFLLSEKPKEHIAGGKKYYHTSVRSEALSA